MDTNDRINAARRARKLLYLAESLEKDLVAEARRLDARLNNLEAELFSKTTLNDPETRELSNEARAVGARLHGIKQILTWPMAATRQNALKLHLHSERMFAEEW